MNKRRKDTLIICGLIVIIIGLGLGSSLQRRVSDNPPEAVGNTAGNLNNGGYFCEDGGIVYFANAYDDYTLYTMNSDESDIRKMSNSQVKLINGAGKYLYYYQTNSASVTPFSFLSNFSGIYRTKKSNNKSSCLTRDTALNLSLAGNYLFYEKLDEKGSALYKTGIQKSTPEKVVNYSVNPASVQNGIIYFNGTTRDHFLYSLNAETGAVSTLWTSNLWNPVVVGDDVYYMDLNTNYNLCRYSLSEQKVTVLSTERVEFFNVYGNYVYFQTNSQEDPCLKRVTTDGHQEEVVMDGVFEHINITSEYVYFNRFQEPVPVYKTSTVGPVQVSTFDAAMQAAVSELN